MKTKEKILVTSIELFNRHGVQAITTNHISKGLNISPGNLYFHYDNKEAILLELFKRMISEMYEIWDPKTMDKKTFLGFLDENFQISWKYRFFYREMYSLRRKDSELSKLWSKHISKFKKRVGILYLHWVKQGMMIPLNDKAELNYVTESLLAMISSYLQFFESEKVAPNAAHIERGKHHIGRFLLPYTADQTRVAVEKYLTTNF